ncbi:Sporulation and spore germination [Asanoa hainanensis]|uniref:Sporulation and spore germination n=1 Tax=Asanoa hainanensis TaxID=560556 RepID=A0A239PGL0_9ACTN|nr:GerMN domain-containing protein [Asanoa hainanensis]SNT66211.1 Sporulation and spore germination [Asanoa hainanensis]
MTPEETIRRALEAAASTVEVRPDALAAIRARTRRRRGRGWIPWGAGLAVATAAAVTILVLPDAPHPDPPRPGAPTTTAAATPTPAAGPLLAVYYVGPSRDDALVREFHRVAPGSDAVRSALALMFGTAPLDPDYASAWPAGTTVRGVTVAGEVVTVDLGGATPPSAIAAQQLVWTVTAASGLPGVRIGDGDVLRRAPAVDTLAPVWLINPQEGEVVRGGRVDVHVAGFGSTARLEVTPGARGQDLTLRGGSPAQREAQLTLSLPPGTYTLTVTVDGVSDDHTVVVE